MSEPQTQRPLVIDSADCEIPNSIDVKQIQWQPITNTKSETGRLVKNDSHGYL
jgi:hypothetical protein